MDAFFPRSTIISAMIMAKKYKKLEVRNKCGIQLQNYEWRGAEKISLLKWIIKMLMVKKAFCITLEIYSKKFCQWILVHEFKSMFWSERKLTADGNITHVECFALKFWLAWLLKIFFCFYVKRLSRFRVFLKHSNRLTSNFQMNLNRIGHVFQLENSPFITWSLL